MKNSLYEFLRARGLPEGASVKRAVRHCDTLLRRERTPEAVPAPEAVPVPKGASATA